MVDDGGDLSIQGSFEAGLAGADAVVHAAATVVIGRDPSIASAAVDGVENVLVAAPPARPSCSRRRSPRSFPWTSPR